MTGSDKASLANKPDRPKLNIFYIFSSHPGCTVRDLSAFGGFFRWLPASKHMTNSIFFLFRRERWALFQCFLTVLPYSTPYWVTLHLCSLIKISKYSIWKHPSEYKLSDSQPSAGILEQSMEARNRVGIGLSYLPAMLHYTAWRNWFLGSDSCAPRKFKNSGSERGEGQNMY